MELLPAVELVHGPPIRVGASDSLPREVWEQHRDIITRLYRDEKKTLPRVMETMGNEHNFHAT